MLNEKCQLSADCETGSCTNNCNKISELVAINFITLTTGGVTTSTNLIMITSTGNNCKHSATANGSSCPRESFFLLLTIYNRHRKTWASSNETSSQIITLLRTPFGDTVYLTELDAASWCTLLSKIPTSLGFKWGKCTSSMCRTNHYPSACWFWRNISSPVICPRVIAVNIGRVVQTRESSFGETITKELVTGNCLSVWSCLREFVCKTLNLCARPRTDSQHTYNVNVVDELKRSLMMCYECQWVTYNTLEGLQDLGRLTRPRKACGTSKIISNYSSSKKPIQNNMLCKWKLRHKPHN